MAADTTPIPLRHDTLLGVCETLGRDFRINPNIVRILFALALLWDPIVVMAAYVGVGVVLGLIHWLVPDVRVDSPASAAATVEERQDDMPLAA